MVSAQAIWTGLAKSFQVSGRASRSEFWVRCIGIVFAALVAVGLTSVLRAFFPMFTPCDELPYDQFFVAAINETVGFVVPLIFVPIAFRRWHDLGHRALLPVLLAAVFVCTYLLNPWNQFLDFNSFLNALAFHVVALIHPDVSRIDFGYPMVQWYESSFPKLASVTIGLLLANLAVGVWPGQKKANRYGLPPGEATL